MILNLALPVPGNRIVPYGEDRLPSDVLSNGQLGFRVTQRFGDINPAFPGSPHGAVDLGNYNCGAPVYAMFDGTAKTIGPDQYGALGIIIQHDGWTSLYWHLNGFSVPQGASVRRGQQIGIVGKTGLGAVCHLHLEITVAGKKIDPLPYLFGTPLVVDDMQLPNGLQALTFADLGPGNRIRRDPETTEGATVTDTLERVQVLGIVDRPAAPWSINGKTGTTWYFIGLRHEVGFVVTALLPTVGLTALGTVTIPVPAADCSRQDAKLARAGQAFDAIRDAAVAGKTVTG